MEKMAQAAEALLAGSRGDNRDALVHAIRAAELYMAAAREAPSKPEAARLRRRCQELILHAEKLKAQQATLSSSPAQPDILRRASRLHGNDFPPWEADPLDDEFDLRPSVGLFTDGAVFTLSTTQAENFAAWTRPADLFRLENGEKSEVEDAMMQLTDRCDLVQDITTDCSVVASLSAAVQVLVGRHAVLSSIMFPFDYAKRRPRLSASGKYVLRMNFNGCSRRVVIDDRLPASRTDRALFVVDRRNPHLLWPALLEKAYLKVRGGYDFPGSNSGTDLWVLTGWIPEQLFLHREDFDIDETWARIKGAHESHDVVLTLGTGRISAEEEQLMGLIGEHDYAVENLYSATDGSARNLLVKNPWCDGPVMVGTGRPGPQESERDNTAWMALEDVAQHFESMYLNWNPGLFSHRQDRHFTWEMPPKYLEASLVRNPQFTLSSPNGGSVWVLVNRHFVDAELDIARNRRGSMAAVARQLGFMSILIFGNQRTRVQVSDGATYRGPYVDSPQTLARLESSPGKRYTIVVDQHEFPLSSYTFTMSLFSHAPLEVQEAEEKMSYFNEQLGSWSRRTAGGNSSCTSYFQNPQYRLSISKASPVSILVSTDNRDVHVHVDLVWARGERATTVRVKDLVSSSGEYRRGCAVADVPMLEPGVYTMVCSTFEAGQIATFAVRVASMVPVTLDPVPADAAGRLRTPLTAFRLPEGEERRRVPLNASWLTRASVAVHGVLPPWAEDGGRQASSLMIRVSVVEGWGPELVTIAVSGEGEFQESVTAIRTPDFDMEPARIQRRGMWLLIECIGTHHTAWAINGEILSDSPVQVGTWEPL
ncbi:Calpain-like protease palB/cpr-8 [Tolypocladium capitatum]|uniref:Calpain-like protease palB/cpr-8 n=1 Tax=Tolypocladium capitatum TaxID=45235 RepID=A0A2K3Q9M7_9HYPO|nr:Calpain-like protease palB/cpr-8 [Tolypocladium capitatum]